MVSKPFNRLFQYILLISIVICSYACTPKTQQIKKTTVEDTPEKVAVDRDNPPPKPSKLQSQIDLEHEVDSLWQNRKDQIRIFTDNLRTTCLQDIVKPFFLQASIDPDGSMSSYEIVTGKALKKDYPDEMDCLESQLIQSDFNFGTIKIVPSARAGRKAITEYYTLKI